MGLRVGVDTGGTHTDIAVLDVETGVISTLKVPTTPEDLSIGIREGVSTVYAKLDRKHADTARFVYGTTLVTNLLVEKQDVPVGFIGTRGFGDLLEIGRAARRPNVYDLNWRPAPPLVPRNKRKTVRERTAYDGTIIEPLVESDLIEAMDELVALKVTSVALCFLHSYANPANEQAAARVIAERYPQMIVSTSSEIVREFREYERASSTAINAFVKAPIARHLDQLADGLAADGIVSAPHIMRGNGGVMSFEFAKALPAAITHSGPMAGIVGGVAVGLSAGVQNVITLDMGGTSTDVSLVADGSPSLTNRNSIAGHPLLVPMLDLIAIGAGGGSIAAHDPAKGLRIGPRSAGSKPGPACYGQGGTEPTITDANLVAGRLNGGYFLGGKRSLDVARAEEAVAKVAASSGMTVTEAALGIIAIAESYMVDAIKLVSVQRGLDPRNFALIGFGGAGPLHTVSLADELQIRHVIIPPAPGNVSAMGLIAANIRHDIVRSISEPVAAADLARIKAAIESMTTEGNAVLADEDVAPANRRLLFSADVRYVGQTHHLNAPLTVSDAGVDLQALARQFHEQHKRSFGYAAENKDVQIVNLRLSAVGQSKDVTPMAAPDAAGAPVPSGEREVAISPSDTRMLPVYRIEDLGNGSEFASPAIVEYAGSTLFVPPGWTCRCDQFWNIHVRKPEVAA